MSATQSLGRNNRAPSGHHQAPGVVAQPIRHGAPVLVDRRVGSQACPRHGLSADPRFPPQPSRVRSGSRGATGPPEVWNQRHFKAPTGEGVRREHRRWASRSPWRDDLRRRPPSNVRNRERVRDEMDTHHQQTRSDHATRVVSTTVRCLSARSSACWDRPWPAPPSSRDGRKKVSQHDHLLSRWRAGISTGGTRLPSAQQLRP
jgi:hypothetical protein